MRCPVCTSTSFNTQEKVKVKSVIMVPEKPAKPQRYSLMRDVREEFAGSYSALKDKHKFVRGDQATEECVQLLNPQTQALKWMKECQHSYTDEQLDFWLLLQPLTDGGGRIKPTPGPQTFVCVALGISLEPPLYGCLCPQHLTLAIGCRKAARKMIGNVG